MAMCSSSPTHLFFRIYNSDTSTSSFSFFGRDSDSVDETTASADGSLRLNQWQQIYINIDRDSNEGKAYVNGIKSGSTNSLSWTGDFNCSSVTTDATFGGYVQNYNFQGRIDQVRIYNYARTPAQIAWEYNEGKPIAHAREVLCQRQDDGHAGSILHRLRDV